MPAAQSRWFESLILDIVGALISAALIKLLGLNQSSKVGPGCGPAPILLLYPKTRKKQGEWIMSLKECISFIIIFCMVRMILRVIFER